jgi:hypothetical protein
LTGTARYASLNTHIGIEQSRRDDLECLGFVLIYFIKGGLPWQGVKAKSRTEKYQIIKDMKMNTPIEELVKMKIENNQSGNQRVSVSTDLSSGEEMVPIEFVEFMKYCRDLKFDEKPDYNFLRRQFKNLFSSMGYEFDYVYDWNILERKQKRESAVKNREISRPKQREMKDVRDVSPNIRKLNFEQTGGYQPQPSHRFQQRGLSTQRNQFSNQMLLTSRVNEQ